MDLKSNQILITFRAPDMWLLQNGATNSSRNYRTPLDLADAVRIIAQAQQVRAEVNGQ